MLEISKFTTGSFQTNALWICIWSMICFIQAVGQCEGKARWNFFFSFLSQSFHLLSSQSRKLKTIESTWCNSGSWLSEQWSDCEGRVRPSLLGFLQTSKPGRLDLASYTFTLLNFSLPARCRSYVEYAAEQCQARVNSLVEVLTEQGRTILTEVNRK